MYLVERYCCTGTSLPALQLSTPGMPTVDHTNGSTTLVRSSNNLLAYLTSVPQTRITLIYDLYITSNRIFSKDLRIATVRTQIPVYLSNNIQCRTFTISIKKMILFRVPVLINWHLNEQTLSKTVRCIKQLKGLSWKALMHIINTLFYKGEIGNKTEGNIMQI